MFCAAAGMALAHRLHAKLEFDLSHYRNKDSRRYELGVFDLPAVERVDSSGADEGGIAAGLSTLGRRLRKMRRRDIPADWSAGVWRQPGFQFDPSFNSINDSIYLTGYFQSPQYFDTIADRVRAAFDLRPILSAAGKAYAEAARGDDTIAVHVRRGDYVSNPNATAHHGVMGADYYRRALRLIARSSAASRLFVVSDDEPEARRVLAEWPGAQFVSGTTQFDDMHLISSCRHRVIANSSFSWWGAWLDRRSDGITVAPRAWFSRPTMLTMYVDDLFPTGWFLT